MYLAYSLLTLRCLCRRVAVLRVPGDSLQEIHRQPPPAPRLSADLLQRRRRGVDLDSCRLGRRSADRAGARRGSRRRAIRACGCSCRPRRWRGRRWRERSLQHVDAVFYFPFDWAFIVRRTLNIVKPRVFIMMETEIWPNLLRLCRKRGVKTVVINGRISSRSYPRYRLIRPFFRRVLADVDRFCMQSEESARRLVRPRRRCRDG